MKNTKINVAKALLVVSLISTSAFAEGDMGSGGFVYHSDENIPVKTDRTPEEGDMGSGGRISGDESYLDWVLRSVSKCFDWAI